MRLDEYQNSTKHRVSDGLAKRLLKEEVIKSSRAPVRNKYALYSGLEAKKQGIRP